MHAAGALLSYALERGRKKEATLGILRSGHFHAGRWATSVVAGVPTWASVRRKMKASGPLSFSSTGVGKTTTNYYVGGNYWLSSSNSCLHGGQTEKGHLPWEHRRVER